MHIKAKKSLGQNFLIDRNILEQIIDTVEIENNEILEIGPGTGNLTTYILKKKPKIIFISRINIETTSEEKTIWEDSPF